MDLARVKYKLNHVVMYKAREYKLTGCTIRRNEKNNELYYQAELLDIVSQNSVIICKLTDIQEKDSDT